MANMVANVKGLPSNKVDHNRRGWIVEIVGPAGAGKTSLFRTLDGLDPGIQAEYLPPVWNLGYFPFFVKNILQITPVWMRLRAARSRHLTRRELAWMAMLMGWPETLKKKAVQDQKVILLDQGPVFLMAILSEFGPSGLRYSSFPDYWNKTIDRWVHTLNMVIWLDAPDDVLIKRIRSRSQEHLVKEGSDREIQDFLARYRSAYELFINQMKSRNGEIKVVQLDTAKNSVDDLVHCILQNLPLGNNH